MRDLRLLMEELEKGMRGENYSTTFDCWDLGYAENMDDLKKLIKKKYPFSEPFETEFTELDESEFWDEIEFGFMDKGGRKGGMNLSELEEKRLSFFKGEYMSRLKTFMNKDSNFYFYSSNIGIPGHIEARWVFRLLFNNKNRWFFVLGAGFN